LTLPAYNFFFAINHNHGGKLHSHLYFFRGFCEYLNPKYTFLLDIGTKPLPKSLSVLYQYLENHHQCAGVCGEIEVNTKSTSCLSPANFRVSAQFVEYKFSYFIDKAFGSLFGFVSFLPGGFSGYRWKAINGPPLDKYFEGLNTNLSCFQSNMYLAAEKIMGLAIVGNTERSDTLAYVPGAVAVTDPPKSLQQFMLQRRRWINGSTFASFYVLANCHVVFKSRHSMKTKFTMFFLFVYYFFSSFLTWILVGSFYATFSILLRATFPADDTDKISDTANTIEINYILCLLFTVIWSSLKDVQKSGFFYSLVTVIFGLVMYLSYFTLIQYFISNDTNIETTFALLLILGLYFLPTLLNIHRINNVVVFMGGLFAYLFLVPFYINVLMIYSFCNTHDVT
jgi:chitin synthase